MVSKSKKTKPRTQKITYKKRDIEITKQRKLSVLIDGISIQTNYDKKLKKYSSIQFPYEDFSSAVKLAKKVIDCGL